MVQIYSKRLNAKEQHTANKIKLVRVIKAANQLLARYNATPVVDTNPSYVHAPIPNAKNTKLPDPSLYLSYSGCVSDLTQNLRVDKSVAENHCKSVNPDSGQSGPSETKSGIRKQASIVHVGEIAPWAVVSAGVSPNETITLDNGIRSASSIPFSQSQLVT